MAVDFHRLDGSSADWGGVLNQFQTPSVYQSWEWGEHKKRSGWQPERWVFGDGSDSCLGVCQFLTKKLSTGLRLVWAPGGPVVRAPSAWTKDFARALWQVARSGHSWAYFRCDPYEAREFGSDDAEAMHHSLHRPWFFLNPGTSVWLDLPDSESEFVQGMVKNHRYRFRQAQKAGLAWTHGKSSASVRDFTEILQEVRKIKSMGTAPPKFTEIQNLVDDLGDKAHLTLGYRDGKPVVGALCLLQGHRGWYSYAGCNSLGRQVSASYALVPEIAKVVRWLGVRQLDLAGISPWKKKYAGVNDFKKGFGGRTVSLAGEWEAGGFVARLAGNLAVAWRRV